MKKVILHIGRHKSGTSSLQHMFYNNRSLLKDHGWVYPETMKSARAHHDLASWYCPQFMAEFDKDKKAELASYVGQFWQQAVEIDNLIISSENFQNAQPNLIAKDLQGTEVEIIIYFREICDYFLSAYSQYIKANKVTDTIAEYEKLHFNVDYYKFIQAWRDAFPSASIICRLYDDRLSQRRGILSDFISETSLRDSGLSHEQFIQDQSFIGNASIYGDLLDFKRALNSVPSENIIGNNLLYGCLQQISISNPELSQKASMNIVIYKNLKKKCLKSCKKAEKIAGFNSGVLFNAETVTTSAATSVALADFNKEGVSRAFNNIDGGLGDKLMNLLESNNFM